MTAELAVLLPIVTMMVMAIGGVTRVAVVKINCLDAARAGARELARGEPEERVRAVIGRLAPVGSSVDLRDLPEGDVEVRVRARPAYLPGPGTSALWQWEIQELAVARKETS